MFFKCINRVCSVFLLLVCFQVFAEIAPSTPSTEAGSYVDNLRQGGQNFNQGNYSQAKAFYLRALSQVMGQARDAEKGSPSKQVKSAASLYYNLGSVYYKLGEYDQSKTYFEKLIDDKSLRAVAYYNLALIENKQSHKATAIDYLYMSKNATTDAQLSKLVDKQLLKLSKQAPDRNIKKTVKDWHAYLYLTPGYDSNIKFAPLEIASNESGKLIQGIGIFDKKIAGEGLGKKKPALLVTSMIFLSNYFSTDFNDYNLFDVGLRYLWPVNRWRNRIDLNVRKSTYGHVDYQQSYLATFKTKRRFSGGNTFRLRYRYEQIESLDTVFDYLEGNRQKLRMGYQFTWPKDALHLWYELEINNRNNTLKRNYSPTRNTARIRYEKKLNAKNKTYAEVEYRHSEYEPTPFQDRLDKRTGFLLAYVYDIKPDWQLQARWGFRSNRSTDSVFSYDRHLVLLTARKSF